MNFKPIRPYRTSWWIIFLGTNMGVFSPIGAVLGQKHLEMAEDAVQAAMQQALRTWGPRGVPSDPGGWLYKVAYRIAIDNLRRSKRHQKYLENVDFDRWNGMGIALPARF